MEILFSLNDRCQVCCCVNIGIVRFFNDDGGDFDFISLFCNVYYLSSLAFSEEPLIFETLNQFVNILFRIAFAVPKVKIYIESAVV